MNEKKTAAVYEPPMLVEVGGFTALTQANRFGLWVDSYIIRGRRN